MLNFHGGPEERCRIFCVEGRNSCALPRRSVVIAKGCQLAATGTARATYLPVTPALPQGAAEKMKLAHILVPVDRSPSSAEAVERAAQLAAHSGARITLLHAWEPLYAWGPFMGAAMVSTDAGNVPLAKHIVEEAQRTLAEHKNRLAQHPLEVKTELVEAPPKNAIRDALNKERFDLVVMATHGRTGFARVTMGSIAEWVVRHSPVPVLTVRGPSPAAP
jgi:nucleotide-binding universal stress UspA family protein